jgi:hypothetical protein
MEMQQKAQKSAKLGKRLAPNGTKNESSCRVMYEKERDLAPFGT